MTSTIDISLQRLNRPFSLGKWGRLNAGILSWFRMSLLFMVLMSSHPIFGQTKYVSLGAFAVKGKICPRIVSLIEEEGGNVDWGPRGWLAYDCFDSLNKKYKVCLLLPDGKLGGSITNYRGPLARTAVGNPAWYPDGTYLVVQAADVETPQWAEEKPALYRRITAPSVGFQNNLWFLASDGSNYWPLTSLTTGSGAIHPRFSHKGDWLLWSELISLKPQKWVMRLAPFHIDKDGPRLGAITTLDPLNNPFYEDSDFSPDDQSILFSTTATENDYQHLAIARYDRASKTTTFLTDPKSTGRNQFAHYSPDGQRILFASTVNVAPRTDFPMIPSDYWIMNSDGSAQRRLTYFNEPDAPEYRLSANVAGNLSWNPNGRSFVANLQLRTPSDSSDDFISSILLINLPEELPPTP